MDQDVQKPGCFFLDVKYRTCFMHHSLTTLGLKWGRGFCSNIH